MRLPQRGDAWKCEYGAYVLVEFPSGPACLRLRLESLLTEHERASELITRLDAIESTLTIGKKVRASRMQAFGPS